jgi:hypothetical protein
MMMTQMIAELEAGISTVAADGTTIIMRLAGPVGSRVVNVVSGPAGGVTHYQAPATRAAILAAAQIASDVLAIHNL